MADDNVPPGYDPKFCDALIDYFTIAPFQEITKAVTDKRGNSYDAVVQIPNQLKYIADFAWEKCGCTEKTLVQWGIAYPHFGTAMDRAREMQISHINACVLAGLWPERHAQFVLMNLTEWRPKREDTSKVQLTGCVTTSRTINLPAKKPVGTVVIPVEKKDIQKAVTAVTATINLPVKKKIGATIGNA